MKQPKVGAARKRRESYPAKAEAQRKRWADPIYRERWIAGAKERWATPEHRAKMAAAGSVPVNAEDHREAKLRSGDNPTKYSRLGIPSGMNRTTAEAAWAEAAKQADAALRGIEAQGVLGADDDALAKAVLHALAVLALGPTKDKRTKARALRVLLDYTKARPAERRAITKANSPTDEWMQSVLLTANRQRSTAARELLRVQWPLLPDARPVFLLSIAERLSVAVHRHGRR
jgi:hypothetical protein